ncbi:hypothetical protein [Pontibacter roseus]|uniref:hypothetical protein n=1 Tax=Pontibacter roseus TaxID=336989 RepID=UPI00037491F1|nr:hypothetical protein [Pontibacter roseus]
MENNLERDLAVFQQVCEVNELDPQTITEEAQRRFPDSFTKGPNAERFIWTALDHRAQALLQGIATQESDTLNKQHMYTIDADPAAPSFVIQEDRIRSQYGGKAEKIIEALGQVQLPVTG